MQKFFAAVRAFFTLITVSNAEKSRHAEVLCREAIVKLPTQEEVLALLRTGTPDELASFLKQLPLNPFKEMDASLIGITSPVIALGPMVTKYCQGSHPEWGAVLAAALHERAVEIWQTVPDHGLLPTTLSGLACNHVRALALLGRSLEVLEATEQYIPFYERLKETENLPTLKVLRIEALVNLKRIDEAEAALRGVSALLFKALFSDPVVSLETRRLKRIVERIQDARASACRVVFDAASRGDGIANTLEESDELGLDSVELAPAPSPISEPRWLNAEMLGHSKLEPLQVGKAYVLEFGIDLQAMGDTHAAIPSAVLLFTPGEDVIELTLQLQSSHFDIASPVQKLQLPRAGPSQNKAQFEVTPQHAGRGTLTATVHKKGNFVLQMEITYSIGTLVAEPPSAVSYGRPIAAAVSLQPRQLGLVIKPAPPEGGYECTVIAGGTKRVILPITEAELGDAIKTARDGLMSVVSQRDESSRLVFQTGVDVDEASATKALRTLARTGARLFQRIFFGPQAGVEVRQLGDWLRTQATNPKERLRLQIVAQRFPVPWGLLYVGKVDQKAKLSWDYFLGMRCIIEQLPLVNTFVDDFVIHSEPSLAVSVNMNSGIDDKMKSDVVARQMKFWRASAAALGPRLQFAQYQSRADFLDALMGNANDQLMYLYCHAITAGPGDPGGISSSCLVLTEDDRLTLDDLNIEAPSEQPLGGHPLVFINACESAELTPAFYDGFVPYFMAKTARGVIGTECKIPAVFATEWALRFFPRFLGGEPLGELFFDLRLEFCSRHHNPLGLLYAVYCDADTQIKPGLKIR